MISKEKDIKLEHIKFESTLVIKNVPLQWIPKIELYYPDLPSFPIVYIHTICEGERLYGFPVSVSPKILDDSYCDLEILFLCNKNIETGTEKKYRENAVSELEKRFGLNNKVTAGDVISSSPQEKYKKFFSELWYKYISPVVGDSIPYGNFYEEIFSIVRFVSAWNPKTGRQSEMRMLYNFLSKFGQKIQISGKWSFLDFYLLPTYDDLLLERLCLFPKFKDLYHVMQKIWNKQFTKIAMLEGTMIKTMKKGWPQTKEDFIRTISKPLYDKGEISSREKLLLEWLVDSFNRNPPRTAFFISSLMLAFEKDYRLWDKSFFINFYTLRDNQRKNFGSGISEKVIACFLQQGFGNEEVTPVDTWVKSFYREALGIADNKTFLETFSKMGKLERMIWLASQNKKTNISNFFDILWCIRYGTRGNTELRGANPLSCYECSLIDVCPNYEAIKSQKVYVTEGESVKHADTAGNNIIREGILKIADQEGCSYICLTDDNVPKKIWKKYNKRWILIDEFSGYLLDQKTKFKEKAVSVMEFIASLPRYEPEQKRNYADADI